VLLLHSNLILKSNLIDWFSKRFNDNSEMANFLLSYHIHHATSNKLRSSKTAMSSPKANCVP